MRLLSILVIASVVVMQDRVHASLAEQPVALCSFDTRGKELAGKIFTFTGQYEWDMHFQIVLPSGCKDEQSISVKTDLNFSNTVSEFLHRVYPNIDFGGGMIWGKFTGIGILSDSQRPSIYITNVQIDESKRMTPASK